MRTIWHLDLDSFFVSAERLRNPKLKGIPVAVGGQGPRAVISSASYEARKFGVRSAMPTARALKLCPKLVIVAPDFELYSKLSKQVFRLFESHTPVWEQVSVDEGYLDMTGTEALFGPPLIAAEKLRAEILKATGLTASIGIASNRLVAKIATDFCKPNDCFQVAPGKEAAFLAPLEVEKLPGCGKATTAWLHGRGIKTVADLQRYPVDVLEKHLGKFGSYLHDSSMGRGSVEFNEEAKSRSISREETFNEDVDDLDRLKRALWEMATDLGRQLREEGLYARAIRLKLRYPPFHTITRSRVLDEPARDDKTLFESVVKLFHDNWDTESSIRLIGMGCVLGAGQCQLDLFSSHTERSKQETIDHLKDALVKRFGTHSLKTGRDLK